MLILKIAAGIVVGFLVLIVGCTVLLAVAIDSSDEALITGDAEDVIVRVTGDAGRFSGSIGAVASSRTIEGTTPQDFTIEGKGSSGIFTVVIQKQESAGLLRAEIVGCPDKQPHVAETSAAFGVLTVSC